MSGATANHAKKQTKNAIHAKWKARIGIVLNLSSSKRFARASINRSSFDRSGNASDMQPKELGTFQGLIAAVGAGTRAHGADAREWVVNVVRRIMEGQPIVVYDSSARGPAASGTRARQGGLAAGQSRTQERTEMIH